jgi:hypothetical protein
MMEMVTIVQLKLGVGEHDCNLAWEAEIRRIVV